MRTPRIKEPTGAYYHVLSRIVDRRRVLDDGEKERFRRLLRRVERFSGVTVLTHAVLGNHFHILLHVPAPGPVGDDGLVLGSRAYVDDAFLRYRDRFSPKRTSGARRIVGADLGDLWTARRLRLAPITVPGG